MLAVTLPLACSNLDQPTPSTTPQIVVHGVLDSGSPQQRILLTRARTGSQTTQGGVVIGNSEPIRGAVVTILAPDGTTMLGYELASGTYVFSPAQSRLLPGGTYSLYVRTTLGEVVTGTTTIPSAPAVPATIPRHVFFSQRDTLLLSWPAIPNARGYEVVLQSHNYPDYRRFTDSSIVIPGTALSIAGDPVFPHGGSVDVVAIAVDANYYDYYRSQSDPFAGAAPSHLIGGVGVFGSIGTVLTTELVVR